MPHSIVSNARRLRQLTGGAGECSIDLLQEANILKESNGFGYERLQNVKGTLQIYTVYLTFQWASILRNGLCSLVLRLCSKAG